MPATTEDVRPMDVFGLYGFFATIDQGAFALSQPGNGPELVLAPPEACRVMAPSGNTGVCHGVTPPCAVGV